MLQIDNMLFVVPNALVGEHVRCKILKMNKHMSYAKLVEVIKASTHRVTPECPYFDKCGGCQLQHMDRYEQAQFKRQFVEDNIRKIAHIDREVKPILDMVFKPYRNKAQFPVRMVGGKLHIGFYRKHSNDIIDIDTCMIQSNKINEVLLYMRNHLNQYDFTKELRHILVKHSYLTDEVMIVFIAKKIIDIPIELIDEMKLKIKGIVSIQLNINDRNNNVILGNEDILMDGSLYLHEQLDDFIFELSSKAFYQVNPYQTKVLYATALDAIDLQGSESVIELYSGVGTISMYLANKAKEVIGVEIVDEAVKNAQNNAKLNKLDNVSFVCEDAGEFAYKYATQQKGCDVVVIDPPRKGCDELARTSIVNLNPEKILYISCHPSSLARDIAYFSEAGYSCNYIQPVDMFPHTFHVETVVLMSRVEK